MSSTAIILVLNKLASIQTLAKLIKTIHLFFINVQDLFKCSTETGTRFMTLLLTAQF